MITDVAQRWRSGRAAYRPAGEVIATSAYEVAAIEDDNTAKGFVLRHHYSASFPAARFRFGLYRGAALVGVCVFSQPCNNAVLSRLPCDVQEGTELGRLVLLDDVPANGESWFVARCFDLLRAEGVRGVVSFSDPVPRTDAAGARVFVGHVGTIYQALNAAYNGRSRAETRRLLPDGTVLHNRALQKIRQGEQGREYVEALLVRHGARPRAGGDVDGWLRAELPRLVRPLRHTGNHRYLWGLDRMTRRHLPASLPYPKFAA